MCEYRGECCRWYVVYKVTCKFCGDFYVINNQNTLKNNGTTLTICAPKGHAQ